MKLLSEDICILCIDWLNCTNEYIKCKNSHKERFRYELELSPRREIQKKIEEMQYTKIVI